MRRVTLSIVTVVMIAGCTHSGPPNEPATDARHPPAGPRELDGAPPVAREPPTPIGAPPGRWSMQIGHDISDHYEDFDVESDALEAALLFDFSPDGDVNVLENGAHVEFRLSKHRGYLNQLRVWETRWTGNWSIQGGRVYLALKRKSRRCDLRERRLDESVLRRSCEPTLERVMIECEPAAETEQSALRTTLWSCATTDLGGLDTPEPWRLSPRCVRVSGLIAGELDYRACQERPRRPDASW